MIIRRHLHQLVKYFVSISKVLEDIYILLIQAKLICTLVFEQFDHINEGITYIVGEGAGQDLFRFSQADTGLQFYCANTSERDSLLAQADSGYIYEGVAY